jgi:hypothetical protein
MRSAWTTAFIATSVLGVAAIGVAVPALFDASPAAAAPLPVVALVARPSGAAFGPGAVEASWSGPTSAVCTAANEAVILVNQTGVAHQIFGFPHRPLGLFPAGAQSGLCFFGHGSATFRYSLVDGSTLKVTVS